MISHQYNLTPKVKERLSLSTICIPAIVKELSIYQNSTFLGLRNLTILKEAVERIQKIRGVTIDVEKIPLDDKKTYELFGRGETMSVFQFGSTGMQKWLKELKPSNLEDLIAMASSVPTRTYGLYSGLY
jgi:hypothetical protein